MQSTAAFDTVEPCYQIDGFFFMLDGQITVGSYLKIFSIPGVGRENKFQQGRLFFDQQGFGSLLRRQSERLVARWV